jgi:hypothetical protein
MTAGPLTANKRSPGLLGWSRIPFPRQVRAAPAGQDAIPVIRVGAASRRGLDVRTLMRSRLIYCIDLI